ncbi:MAG TPA: single-stranded-DNA-specific exonuclease RecJ [Thermoleophilaceae bacterium]|nr:single-stranded-DNA-specific exonuclease RecJ [Thermoleophilaceae bacterium]
MDVRPSRWTCDPFSVEAAEAIARELGLSRVAAQVLARRGYDTPDLARAFMQAADSHDPTLLNDAAEACRLILAHVERGSRIVVHGDYDVDGVCATAVMVSALRRLGASPSWYLPSRFEDGYGLNGETVERLAREGTGLIVTVDCGVTAAAEVERALAAGVDLVVTDHHKPGEQLPACPVVHPALGDYPFASLCGTAVAYKLGQALAVAAGANPDAALEDMDLVALATMCDLVPLVGENRRLAREGITEMRRGRRVGLRALMNVSGLAPAEVDERAAGFRLGPRINAAGRLQRADAALELMLTQDEDRAAEVARELDQLNSERQDEETRTLFAAEAELKGWAHLPAIVVAGDGWHPGVVGIVASRLVERYHRPALVAAIDGDAARGSGRSIKGFDLHAGLSACADLLSRFGGHRMAAGFELPAAELPRLREAFAAHAASVLTPWDLDAVQCVDAIVSPHGLGLPLAEEIASLGPFGPGNPTPALLIPSARLENVVPMGDDKQHARLTISSGGARARTVAFRTTATALAKAGESPHHVAVALEVNEWNGTIEPRLILKAVCPPNRGACAVIGERALWDELEAELDADPRAWLPAGRVRARHDIDVELTAPDPFAGARGAGAPASAAARAALHARPIIDRRGHGISAVCGELLAAGESVLAVCADARRRGDGLSELVAGLALGKTAFAAVSWPDLIAAPSRAAAFRHVVLVDPPPVAELIEVAGRAPASGGVYLGWGPAETAFAQTVLDSELDLRPQLTSLYRILRESDAQGASGESLQAILRGDGRYPRAGRVAGRLIRVLTQLQLATYERSNRTLRIEPDAPKTTLDLSTAFTAYAERLAQARAYLGYEASQRIAAAA